MYNYASYSCTLAPLYLMNFKMLSPVMCHLPLALFNKWLYVLLEAPFFKSLAAAHHHHYLHNEKSSPADKGGKNALRRAFIRTQRGEPFSCGDRK